MSSNILQWNFGTTPLSPVPTNSDELLEWLDCECTADSRRAVILDVLIDIPMPKGNLLDVLPPQAATTLMRLKGGYGIHPKNTEALMKALVSKLDPGPLTPNHLWYMLWYGAALVYGLFSAYGTLANACRRCGLLAYYQKAYLMDPHEPHANKLPMMAEEKARNFFMAHVRAAVKEVEDVQPR